MKRKFAGLLAMTIAGSLMLTACSSSGGGSTAEGGDSSVSYLRMCSGTQGATWTTVGSAMMEYAGSDLGISASTGPGGAAANPRAVSNGEYEMGWSFTSTLAQAYAGEGDYAADGAMENLTHVMSIFPSQYHMVVPADSDVQSLADLNGKIVNFTPVTETSYTITVAALEAYGITQDTIESAGGTVTLTRFNEASELMKNGELDYWTACIAYPASTVSDLAFDPGIRMLSIEEDMMDDVLGNLPEGFEEMVIPAGTYEGQDEDVHTVGTIGAIFCTTDIPEDVVYNFLQSMYNNWDKLVAINPTAFGDLSVENWLDGASIPLHPGAQRFYEEMGLLEA